MKQINIGGDRLGTGNKMNVTMHGYERSTHDLGYLWKNTQSPGTLVPFMNLIGLPGDTFDIKLDSMVKTLPTIGPLFGSFKLQLDVFTCPIRLYNKFMHNNKLNVGMSISEIKFPLIELTGRSIIPTTNKAPDPTTTIPPEFQQINQSSILAYLGIRGVGGVEGADTGITVQKNAIPYLAYWDIFKNYYANKQEENAYVIHGSIPEITSIKFDVEGTPSTWPPVVAAGLLTGMVLEAIGTNITFDNVQLLIDGAGWTTFRTLAQNKPANLIIINDTTIRIKVDEIYDGASATNYTVMVDEAFSNIRPKLTSFPLANLDLMREKLLTTTDAPYVINDTEIAPYKYPITKIIEEDYAMAAMMSQEGLAVKTYQSDIFNNWIQTEWVEGAGSISAITAISTAGNSFTIDTLNLSKKVYDMLNRIAVSGGSLEDYISAVYDHDSKWRAETPVYHGGLSKEIVFQEVISTAATTNEPLASLAGKGIMSNKHKGGTVIINVDEPVFIMGIVSITPRVDYSQGNDWTTNLKTLDDLHKPALDGIGYQDLITDQMAFWDTNTTGGTPTYKSAGKQPAWLNYMTNFNKTYGNFADQRSQMFMTLNRNYECKADLAGNTFINDLTTYIDPAKFNYAFAQVDLTAMNFWVQVGCDITARRKMSAKLIPNL